MGWCSNTNPSLITIANQVREVATMTKKNLTINPEMMDFFVLNTEKCEEHFGRILDPMEVFVLYHRRCKKSFNRGLIKHLIAKQWKLTRQKSRLLTDLTIDSFTQSILDRLDLENQKLTALTNFSISN